VVCTYLGLFWPRSLGWDGLLLFVSRLFRAFELWKGLIGPQEGRGKDDAKFQEFVDFRSVAGEEE